MLKTITGLDILHKLIQNILKSPKEEKFRIFKKANKAIQSKLMVLGEADIIALIELLGYVDMGEEHVFIGEHYLELGYGAHQIETQVLHLQMLTMNEEDRKK